jgi:PPOX class probable F420-dependent enzyme
MGINQRSQIAMGESEIERFIVQSRTATVATIGPGGFPHLVAMWYGIIDGEIWIETKLKSQKVVNLRRDNRASLLIEGGSSYASLRGVALEGTAEIFEDRDVLWRVGINIYERYTAPYSEELNPAIEALIHKRVAVRFHIERTRSWDHSKLNLPDLGISGSTAAYR